MAKETMFTKDSSDMRNTRTFYKGKSFRYNYEWNEFGHYSNDDFIQDFVSYKGKMYVCVKANEGIVPTDTNYWQFVMEGQVGEQGETGIIFVPFVDQLGNLSWSNDGGLPNPATVNIKGGKGEDGSDGESNYQIALRNGFVGSEIQWLNSLRGSDGRNGTDGKNGLQGVGLQYIWTGTQLGVKRESDPNYVFVDLRGPQGMRGTKGDSIKGDQGDIGPIGPAGPSIMLQVYGPDAFGNMFLQKRYSLDEPWVSFFDMSGMRGAPGRDIILERNPKTGNVEWRYQDEPATSNRTLVPRGDIMGPPGATILKSFVGDDGFLYIQISTEDVIRRVGYVRGDQGDDGREILLRIDSDANIGPGETGTGTHLQWKYAGENNRLWRNLIQINELFNIALAGLKLEYEEIPKVVNGETRMFDRLWLSTYNTAYDVNGNLILTDKLANISYVDVPVRFLLLDITYDEAANEMVLRFQTADGIEIVRVPVKITRTFLEIDLTSQIDGITDTFSIPDTIQEGSAISVYYNGQRQFNNVHYTVSFATNELILGFVPEIGDQLFIVVGDDSGAMPPSPTPSMPEPDDDGKVYGRQRNPGETEGQWVETGSAEIFTNLAFTQSTPIEDREIFGDNPTARGAEIKYVVRRGSLVQFGTLLISNISNYLLESNVHGDDCNVFFEFNSVTYPNGLRIVNNGLGIINVNFVITYL